ncbi:MAG: hypothetical protein AB7I27_00440 [Bacteriovoracaceae bacterium]
MAAPKGHPRYGGRVKGQPNKSTQELLDIAKKHNCNPFEILIMFANGDYEGLGYEEERTVSVSEFGEVRELTISPELRAKCAEKACEYLHPKRKAVEHSVSDETVEKVISYEEYIRSLK